MKSDEREPAKPTQTEPKVWPTRADRNHALAKDGSVFDSEMVAVPVILHPTITPHFSVHSPLDAIFGIAPILQAQNLFPPRVAKIT